MCGPCARAMKRGVPPTARKARTGEFTPPGITRLARSNSSALVVMASTLGGSPASMNVARILGRRHRLAVAGRWRLVDAVDLVFAVTGQGPEEAVGNDVSHAGSKARVERLVEEGERLADG